MNQLCPTAKTASKTKHLFGFLLVLFSLCWLPPSPSSVVRAARSKNSTDYPIEQLKLIRYVLQMLQRSYVDPTQLSSARMFRGALAKLEQKLPSFLAKWDKKKKQIKFHLGPHQQILKQARFLGIFDVWIRLRPVAKLIRKHYRGKESLANIEYFMVQGMMSTLDKQSMIINPRLQKRSRRKRFRRGKIGVLLRWKNKQLWVTKTVLDGPAEQAGIKGGDRIVRINGESIKGRKIWDWIAKISGLRGTRLSLHIARKGWKKPKRFVLIRAAIPTPNVTGHILPGKIGYVRLRQFIDGSALAIREKLASIRHQAKGTMMGLILDLRHNGGGLVREAVAICSLFVEKGVAVTYAGANTKRRTYNVTGKNIEERYPMIVLIDGYSASASELLSGALHNHGRALIVGRQSYGKGTVQITGRLKILGLYSRITIAQYLLPGNQSIQAVGIKPDIEILPVRVSKNATRYYSAKPRDLAKRHKRWPSFLLQNLDGGEQKRDGSLFQIHRLIPTAKKQRSKRRRAKKRKRLNPKSWFIDASHPLGRDFDVWVARYFLAHSKSGRKDIFFAQIKRSLKKLRRKQERQLTKAILKMGLNWQRPKRTPKPTTLEGKVEVVGAKLPLQTGRAFRLRLTVKNTGKATAYRVRSVIYANSRSIRYKELLLGRIKAGKSVSQEIKLTLKEHELSRTDILRFRLQMEGNTNARNISFPLPWKSPARPQYAVSYHIQDPAPDGNGDGRLQPGERAKLLLVISNNGPSHSPALRVIFSPGILKTRQIQKNIGKVGPSEARTVIYPIRVPDHAKRRGTGAQIVLYDRKLRHIVHHRLHIPIVSSFSGFGKTSKTWVTLTKQSVLKTAPQKDSYALALAPAQTRFQVLRVWKKYLQIRLPSNLLPPEFQPKKAKKTSKKAKKTSKKAKKTSKKAKKTSKKPSKRIIPLTAWVAKIRTQPATQHTAKHAGIKLLYRLIPPRISLKQQAPIQSSTAQFTISINVLSRQGIKDCYLVQKKRKVFYRAVQYDKPKGRKEITLKVPVKLKKGVNRFRLTVRTAQSSFHRSFYVTYIPKNPI